MTISTGGRPWIYCHRSRSFRTFKASEEDTNVDLPTLKRDVRDSVLAGLQQGIPALAWSPMSREIAASHHHGVCWGLIIGYGEAHETYTIRHPFVEGPYDVRYDAIGHAEVCGVDLGYGLRTAQRSADERAMHLTALRNASCLCTFTTLCRRRRAQRQSAGASPRLRSLRRLAAGLHVARCAGQCYPPSSRDAHVQASCRGRVSARACQTSFLQRQNTSKAAAHHYDREMEALNPLHDLCDAACDREAWLAEERVRARQFIGDALDSDREAIACIESALAILKET